MLIFAGLNHKSGPVEIRERLAIPGLSAARERLVAAGFREAVVLSTCNRFEVYAAVEGPVESSLEKLGESLDDISGLDASAHVRRGWGADAVGHLFMVAAGLDSLVVGESEILGQVKQAYEAAKAAGATGKLTNVLFQRALFVGKLVRERTGIGFGQTSAASVAVELAQRIFGRLHGREALILGAGAMAEAAARHLLSAGAGRIRIANRTWERALSLSTVLGAVPVAWEDFPKQLALADIVIASTGSSEPILARAAVERAMSERRGRALFIIDIAMPRDVCEDAAGLEGVYLYSLSDLEEIVAENVARRRGELDAGREIVRLQAREFSAWLERALRGEKATLRSLRRAAA